MDGARRGYNIIGAKCPSGVCLLEVPKDSKFWFSLGDAFVSV